MPRKYSYIQEHEKVGSVNSFSQIGLQSLEINEVSQQ